jgi:high affinity Mn2+ porin
MRDAQCSGTGKAKANFMSTVRHSHRPSSVPLLALLVVTSLSLRVHAQEADVPAEPGDQPYAFHGQTTFVTQRTNAFHAPYAGANSLKPSDTEETFDATLYAGVRIGSRTELWATPEIDQGFGLSDTLGVAGFPSGEAYKVGKSDPYFKLPRAFARITFDVGGDPMHVEPGLMELGGEQTTDRIVVTAGKFSVVDVFDAGRYAHDPRGDFLNWAAIDAGVFDYAADAWGFTIGAAAEWYRHEWTFRGGWFVLSEVPNGPTLDTSGDQYQWVAEIERRFEIGGRPGRVLLTGFDTYGRLGLLDDAVRAAEISGGPVDIAAVRQYRTRPGGHVTFEQALGAEFGVFARVGAADGRVEAYEFTDIDEAFATGLTVGGKGWKRSDDVVGVALLVNEISSDRRRYLDAGGLGTLVGDGKLPNPGRESIAELFYSARVAARFYATLDYQYVTNPAYNRDRGPVSVLGLRFHAQF